MKTQKISRIFRFYLPVVMIAVWGGIPPVAQEKQATSLLWQENESFRNYPGSRDLFPGFVQGSAKGKSAKAALVLSLAGMLVPVVAGSVAWARQGILRDQVGQYFASGPLLFYEKDPTKLTGPFALIASGAIFGPSLGYLYAGLGEQGFKRAAHRYGIYVGTVMAAQTAVGITSWRRTKPREARKIISGVAIAGGGLLLVAAAIDLAKVPGSVQKRNRALQANALTITPTYFAQHGAPGVKLQVNF